MTTVQPLATPDNRTAAPSCDADVDPQRQHSYFERLLVRFLVGFLPAFGVVALPLWWFGVAQTFGEAAELGIGCGVVAGIISIVIAEMIGSFLDVPKKLQVGAAIPVAVLLAFASGLAADVGRLTLVDPLIEALSTREMITITATEDAPARSAAPAVTREQVSRRSVLLGADGESGTTVAALRLDVPVVLHSLLAPDRAAARYRRPRGSLIHSYDVALILHSLATTAVLCTFFLAGVVPRAVLAIGLTYLAVLTALMLFSDVVLGPGHAVFWVAYAGLPAVGLALYFVQVWRYRSHPTRHLLAPRLSILSNRPPQIAEHYEAFRAGRLRIDGVVDRFIERYAGIAPPLARTPRPALWRFFFARLFEPELRDVAELHFVHGHPLTLSDFHRRPLFERFGQEMSLPLSGSTNAAESAPLNAATPTEDDSCTEVAPLASRALTLELTHDPYVTDVMSILRTGSVHDLAEELVTAQRHDFAAVRNRPLAWWRRILRMPPQTASHHEQVQTILGQLKGVIEDATNLVRSQASLSQAFREAVIAAETANLDFEETKETKLASIADQQARAAEARQRQRKADAPDQREQQRLEDQREAEHAANVAFQRAQKEKHEAASRDQRRRRTTRPTPTSTSTPPPPVTAAERRALLLRAEQLKAEAVSKAEVRVRRELDDLKGEFGPEAEEYRDREAYWNHRLITLKEREPAAFLGQEDQERLHHG
jgi:hypothetical protein